MSSRTELGFEVRGGKNTNKKRLYETPYKYTQALCTQHKHSTTNQSISELQIISLIIYQTK